MQEIEKFRIQRREILCEDTEATHVEDRIERNQQQCDKHQRALKQITPADGHISAEEGIDHDDNQTDGYRSRKIDAECSLNELAAANQLSRRIDGHQNDDGNTGD